MRRPPEKPPPPSGNKLVGPRASNRKHVPGCHPDKTDWKIRLSPAGEIDGSGGKLWGNVAQHLTNLVALGPILEGVLRGSFERMPGVKLKGRNEGRGRNWRSLAEIRRSPSSLSECCQELPPLCPFIGLSTPAVTILNIRRLTMHSMGIRGDRRPFCPSRAPPLPEGYDRGPGGTNPRQFISRQEGKNTMNSE